MGDPILPSFRDAPFGADPESRDEEQCNIKIPGSTLRVAPE
jgi:hypothetical protein